MSATTTVRDFFHRLFRRQDADQERAKNQDAREASFSLNEALYDNSVYLTQCDKVLNTFITGNEPTAFIRGYWNPIGPCVDTYQNCLPGTWGDGIDVAPEVDGEPVNPKLPPLIRKLWRDGGTDTQKGVIQHRAANLGTCVLRPVRVGNKIVLQHYHPSRVFLAEDDGRGNAVNTCFKYKIRSRDNKSPIDDPYYFESEVVEIVTKEEFSQTIDGVEQIPDDARRNRYGFCPVVFMKHSDDGRDGAPWWLGSHSYKGLEPIVFAVNYRITQQDRSIGRHMFPKWLLAGSGEKPREADVGNDKVWYVKLLQDGQKPFAQAIVPQIDQTASLEHIAARQRDARHRWPEIALGELELVSGTSGETLAQVLKQVEARVLKARPNYDHAFIRAIQMEISMGMVDGIEGFDIGAGLGPGSGDRAYQAGLETFQFAPRPALPQTPAQQVAQAQANVADKSARVTVAGAVMKLGASDDEVLRTAGYTDKQIQQIKDEQSRQLPTVNP